MSSLCCGKVGQKLTCIQNTLDWVIEDRDRIRSKDYIKLKSRVVLKSVYMRLLASWSKFIFNWKICCIYGSSLGNPSWDSASFVICII